MVFSFNRLMAQARSAWAINRWKKTRSVIYTCLQHRPKTRLIRGMYTWMAIFIWLKWGVSISCVYPRAEPPFVHFSLPSNVEENWGLIA